MYYALKDWPFYSGGGVGTAFPLDGDFTAEVDYAWTTASQATMCEMAITNADPAKHRPGWRTDEQGNKVKEQDFHFGLYIKYTVYTWLNTIFCDRIQWRKCLEIDKVRESIKAQMDARALFRRLQKI